MLSEKKVTSEEIAANNVKSVPGTKLSGTVTQNKNVFDKLVELVTGKHNGAIDDLTSTTSGSSGADNIGSSLLPGGLATTVRGQLAELKTSVDEKVNTADSKNYTQEEKDKLAGIENNANNYSLPTASTNALGGIKVDGISIVVSNGVAEARAAISPDLTARASIAQEVIERQNADNAEAVERISADNALSQQISKCSPKITGSFSGTKAALTFTDSNYILTDFLTVKLKLHIDISESDSPTFNFNNTGAKQIVYPNKSVIKSALATGSVLELMYNSDISKWYILNELGVLDTSIVDVWQTWVQLAGLSPSTYGSLSAVVSSSSAMTVLCASSKASSYMSKSLSVILPAVAGNVTSSTALGQSATALNALYSEAVANSATALTIETILSASICINALIAIATTSSPVNAISFQSIVSKPTLLLQWRGYSGTSTPEQGFAKTFITGDNKTNRSMTATATFYNCLGFMSELSMMASGAGSSRFMVSKYITW